MNEMNEIIRLKMHDVQYGHYVIMKTWRHLQNRKYIKYRT